MYLTPPSQFVLLACTLRHGGYVGGQEQKHFRAQNNGRSTDNVRPDRGLDRSNSRLAGHFDRSSLDTNIL